MKILIILCLTILLQANCTKENEEKADELFYEASQENTILRQIELLETALKVCFSYELEVSLLTLKVKQSSSDVEKLKLYDTLLESVSKIKNNDTLVKAYQKSVNKAIGLVHKKENPELSIVYEQKADAQEIVEEKEIQGYVGWILFFFALLLYPFLDLFKKRGK
jgi:hypothetical protein